MPARSSRPPPRRAVESYWRCHPLRADRLARALARFSGTPEGWSWRLDAVEEGRRTHFRTPPAPFREPAFTRGPGHCCVCGQPVYRFGWHRDLWRDGKVNRRASWHAACVVAWRFWCDPVDHVQLLKRVQRRRCGRSGTRLLRGAEVDHRDPLSSVWRARRDQPWPDLLAFWGAGNLQVVNREAHRAKTAAEAALRSASRAAPPAAATLA